MTKAEFKHYDLTLVEPTFDSPLNEEAAGLGPKVGAALKALQQKLRFCARQLFYCYHLAYY
jgi:hypothetical protein